MISKTVVVKWEKILGHSLSFVSAQTTQCSRRINLIQKYVQAAETHLSGSDERNH